MASSRASRTTRGAGQGKASSPNISRGHDDSALTILLLNGTTHSLLCYDNRLSSPHAQKDIRYFEVIASEYDSVVVVPRDVINDCVFANCANHIRSGRIMIDLGCGTGHASLRFGKMFQSVIAVDHSKAMLQMARQKLKDAGLSHVEIINQDVLDFLAARRSFSADAIFCIGFLHHLTEDGIAQVVSEASRILVPGGSLLVSEPIRIDPGAVPKEVADWNAASVVTRLAYSRPAGAPDEEPIDEKRLLALFRERVISVDYISHHWEIFPKALPVSETESKQILDLHNRHALLQGNCVTVIARTKRRALQGIIHRLRIR